MSEQWVVSEFAGARGYFVKREWVTDNSLDFLAVGCIFE